MSTTETATEFTVGTKVRVVKSPAPNVVPNGTIAPILANLGDQGPDEVFGTSGERLWVDLPGRGRTALMGSEVEVVED